MEHASDLRIDPEAVSHNLRRISLDPLQQVASATEVALAAGAVECAQPGTPMKVPELIVEITRMAGTDYVAGFVAGFGGENVPRERLRCVRFLHGLDDGGLSYRAVARCRHAA